MSNKLTEIMAWKRREIAPLVRPVSDSELTSIHASLPRPASFLGALRRPDHRLAVIAEIKRRSPSAGDIKAGASSVEQARRCQAADADALSVLTDEIFFGGSLSENLIPKFPRDVVAISESGISTRADAARVRSAGAHAVLVGAALVREFRSA